MTEFLCNINEAKRDFLGKSVRAPMGREVGVVTDIYKDRSWIAQVESIYFDVTYESKDSMDPRKRTESVPLHIFKNYQVVDEPTPSSQQ